MDNPKERRTYRLPPWMKMKLPKGESYSRVKNLVNQHGLHTICTSGNCPNIGDCWNRGTATLMILGDICTRSCKFCGVKSGRPAPVDMEEPNRVAETVKMMKLKHCVLTSVDRDDLKDGGAEIWAATIKTIKELNPSTTIEALIPDFSGSPELIEKVIASQPEVISHNLETVERLTPEVRSVAKYTTSLSVIGIISQAGVTSKSGIMLGLGEEDHEVEKTMDDLLEVGCRIFTIGQYLSPSSHHYPVKEFVAPEKFEYFREIGLKKGFDFVESHPLVRSSYKAESHVNAKKK